MKLHYIRFFKAILKNTSQSLLFYCLGTGPHNFFARQIIYKVCSSGVESVPPNPVSSLVPSMGPLHVDLNADEDIGTNFEYEYESIFPGKRLADKTKPRRTRFVLEVTYGG